MISFGDIEETLADLERVFRKIDTAFLTASIKTNAQPIADLAKTFVEPHRRTGALRKAIRLVPGRKRPTTAQVAIGLSSYETTRKVQGRDPGEMETKKIVPWRYGKFLERGFVHKDVGPMNPDPFMGRAFDQLVDQVVDGVRADVQRELDR